MNRILLAISIGLFFLSCGSSKISESNGEIVRLTIASQRGNCAGSALQNVSWSKPTIVNNGLFYIMASRISSMKKDLSM